ncbi:WD40/YVTN/BNR-like repeat-containing protein [Crocinitomix algicola]|uniref:WD40/YVTN/BNR-like repeat-containing protein n=1 Tax=Crocinitomix algicola TaxID=1740263 RepID=UPI0008364EB5|nr:glycosyl hydrolase [Crocinitomix algicola]
MKKIKLITLSLLISTIGFTQSDKKKNEETNQVNSGLVAGLKFRNIGPALTAGRISDLAVNPNNSNEYYLAIASGGVFKTQNHGVTFEPIFDNENAYSIGCITIDPNHTSTIWVGTGENNNQRSVAYGDGVYKSTDGGKSWKNMGLKNSEHISKIIVDPRNSDVVYVAAYGPLWSSGGERGIYKSIDGGESWERVHFISENSGSADLVMDPSNPDVLYEAVHQRRRHVFTYVGGGKESAIYKSVNGGKTWTELKSGLPTGKMGRVGLAISPADPNYVYAIIEAEDDNGGFYRSIDKGASWQKRSNHKTSGNYYQEIICDPIDKNKVFSMDTWLHHTEDGGKSFIATGEKGKHVDNHCIWVNPENTNHWLVGCDGGLYETYDHAENWHYKPNLPITQFYKVTVDNDEPFYNVYGGTQDNNSLGGPSRTINNAGILNSDWYITNGGDGFESQVDPEDPNIVYAQAQYGWLVRYDRKSGEKIGIQPMPSKGEDAYRWNWDAPLVISNHDHKTLYFAANKVFKSTDRGNSWETISPDLTRQIDRNQLKVMGEIQSPDVVMKNKSTTIYGNIVALDESPLEKDVLYVGTDDGLIHVSKNRGETWDKHENFPGIPKMTYVNMLVASQHKKGTLFAAFNNHKNGDFKPYILRSKDYGKSWENIAGNLPERGSVYALAEDHKNENLLFAGTEFGLFFTVDGGINWVQLKAGIPTIAIRDIAIQKRENDLVLASFGRGFYVLDDYSALRELSEDLMEKEAYVFPIRKALLYVESNPLGLKGTGSQGASMYAAPNPEFGAMFTYYLDESPKSPKSQRKEMENKAKEEGREIDYPTYNEFVAEDNYEDPYLLFLVRDAQGNEVRKIKTNASKGINRVNWNLRYPTTTPIQLNKGAVGRYSLPDEGPLVVPGKYNVSMYLSENGIFKKLTEAVEFEVEALENSSLSRQSEDILAFKTELAELRRRLRGTISQYAELNDRLKHMAAAIQEYPNADLDWMKEVKALASLLHDTRIAIWGDFHKSQRDIETLPGAAGRIETIIYQSWYSTSNVTTTQKDQYAIAKVEYAQIRKSIDEVLMRVTEMEKKMNLKGVPYTPSRPNWKID